MDIKMTGPKGEDFGMFVSDTVPRIGEQISIVGKEFVVVQRVTYFVKTTCREVELDVKLFGT